MFVREDRMSGPISSKEAYTPEVQQVEQFDEVQKVYTYENSQKAIQDFESDRVAEQYNDHLISNAKILMDHKDHRLAINLLQIKIQNEPDNILAIQLMGHCFLKLSEYELARKCFSSILNESTEFKTIFGLAEAYYGIGDDTNAQHYYLIASQKIIEDTDEVFMLYKNLGNIYVRQKNYDLAESYYMKALSMEPDSDTIYVNLGTLEVQKTNYEKALEYLRKAVKLNSKNDRAWVGLAIIHREYGDMELSWGNLMTAMDINPANEIAIKLVIDWGIKQGFYSEVCAKVESYLEHRDQDIEVSFLYAQILTQLKRYPQALVELERVLAHDPNHMGAMDLQTDLKKTIKAMCE